MWVDGAVTRFADPYACPDCRAALPAGARACPACGLDLSTDTARQLFATLVRADELLGLMRAAKPASVPGPASAPGPAPDTRPYHDLGAATAAVKAGEEPSAPTGMRQSAVPKILLTLGALCLLGAALVFLVVTWSDLGVGGRTVVLVLLTLAMAGLTTWSGRHGLRGAVEALGVVTLGFTALDLAGAESAGWFGDPSYEAFLVGLGAALTVVGLASSRALSRTPAGGFVGGEVVATLAGLLALGSSGSLGREPVLPLSLTVLGLGLATVLAQVWQRTVAVRGLGVVAGLGWLTLLGTAVDRAASDDGFTVASVYADGGVVGLAVTTALVLLVAVPPAFPQPLRLTAAAAAYFAATLTLTLPALDEDTPTALLTTVAATLVATGVLLVAPRPWRATGLGVAGPGTAVLTVATIGWLGLAADTYLTTAVTTWQGMPGGALDTPPPGNWLSDPWLLPVAVLAVGLAGWAAWGLVPPRTPADGAPAPAPRVRSRPPLLGLGVAVGLAGAVALMGYAVPVWLPLGLLLAGAAVSGVVALDRSTALLPAVAATLLVLAQPLSWYDEVLTAGCLVITLVLTAVVHALARPETYGAAAGAGGVAALAGLVWTLGAVLDRPEEWTALSATLLVTLVALGRGSLPGSEDRRLTVEVACGLVALPLLALGAEAAQRPPTWAAVHLTVLGAGATALALRPDRRRVAALGWLLLAGATWLRLADIGVSEPEPYTLPSALILLALGLWQLRLRPGLSTRVALSPGLLLALVPSLLWVLAEDDGLRTLLLGLACLALVLAGTWLRWSAPLVLGALVGALVAVREAAPYVESAAPRWSLLGTAGVIMVALALTWETRLAEAKRAAAYLGRLR